MSSNTNLTLYIILDDKIPVESHSAHQKKKTREEEEEKKNEEEEQRGVYPKGVSLTLVDSIFYMVK